MQPYADFAIAFASALVRSDFMEAHRFLSEELAGELPPEALRDKYFGMFRGYTDDSPTTIEFDEENCLSDWPERQPCDLGGVYVGLIGDDVVEAVILIIAETDDGMVIRKIEWGRP